MNKAILLYIFIFNISLCNAQNIGLLYHDNGVSDGFILFTPLKNNEVFLINNCGEKVNQWTFTERPGATCYLLNNGNLLRAGKENIEIRDWNNTVIWTYATTANGIQQHHDIEPLPNGNILCLVKESYTYDQMIANGRNPATSDAIFISEKIIELQPTGLNTANVVWEWKFMDHIIQDFDVSKSNYGIVADHPELLDINYNAYPGDYIHTNGLDYNADLDQILVSARHLSEIYIIDHGTTTQEATGHSGGNSNLGGDFIWRWGNPQVYKQGTLADRKLFLQHDPKWVENGFSDEKKISVFNNGETSTNQNFTSICLIDTENGNYSKTNNKFNPITYDWSWNGSILGIEVNETKQSGGHSLPNGNIIIAETSLGRVSEITKSGNLVWSYKNPTGSISNSTPTYYSQNGVILDNDNSFFRAEKYPAEFEGFIGRDMTLTTGIIENENSLSAICNSLATQEITFQNLVVLNPISNNLIQFNTIFRADSLKIFDINGRLVFAQNDFINDQIEIILTPSIYFIIIQNGSFIKKLKVVFSN